MSEQDEIRVLAERIARRLGSSEQESATRPIGGGAHAGDGEDLTALRAGLAEIQRRLTHIESHIGHDEPCGPSFTRAGETTSSTSTQLAASTGANETRPPHLSGTYVSATHPSQERFGINEAVSEIVDYFEREKVCSVEPGEKPCDHCAMCSSRGF